MLAVLVVAQPDKEVAAAIVAAAATVIGTTLSVIVSRRFEKEKGRDDAAREKKIPVYEATGAASRHWRGPRSRDLARSAPDGYTG